MYHWIRPDVAIPVHGEPRHLTAHAKLAKECQVPEALTALNGSLVRLAPGRAAVIDEVFVGRLALDGNLLIDLDSPAIRQRRRLIQHGTAVATGVLDRQGRVKPNPTVSVRGYYDIEKEEGRRDEQETDNG